MAQPSVAQYFITRKRSAVEDFKADSARKILVLDQDTAPQSKSSKINLQTNLVHDPTRTIAKDNVSAVSYGKITSVEPQNAARKVLRPTRAKKIKGTSSQDIKELLENMKKTAERCVTPPQEATNNKLNKELNVIKRTLCRSSRLNELKASINRFKDSSAQLNAVEKKVSQLQSPKLKTFKSLEFEVSLSPTKAVSPEKPYLSPRKDSTARRNLFDAFSPTKSSTSLLFESPSTECLESSTKPSLKLPFKYRTIAEIFRSIDTVAQILYNRKELITFRKLKPAVEEMLKRNLMEKHLAQIKSIYSDAYGFSQEKVRVFGTGMRQEQWELVITPKIGDADGMTSQVLLNRRRKLYEILVDKVRDYHQEFLQTLIPPMVIEKNNITRWHPEFDLEKVPDIELADLPKAPLQETPKTGKEVLEKARQMFNCNTRMEQALARLREAREQSPVTQPETMLPESVLKGIPKALLEKVRQKQAAKAFVSMTRTADKEKDVQLYSRLPEIARLTRNLFVSEKKGVLELDVVIEKLGNSCRSILNKTEIEEHLQAISKEVPKWLIFHKLRSTTFVKLDKNADLSVVLNKLQKIAKEKSEQ